MQGSPDRPQCGFSAQLVAHLRSTGIAFGHFDILSDAEIRAGLKVITHTLIREMETREVWRGAGGGGGVMQPKLCVQMLK